MISRFPMSSKKKYYPTNRIEIVVQDGPFRWKLRTNPANDDSSKFVVADTTKSVKFVVGSIAGGGGLDWYEGVRIYTLIFKNQTGGIITSRDIKYGSNDMDFNLSLPEISFISAENVRQPIIISYTNRLSVSQ